MITDGLLTAWSALTPLQRSAVRDVYLHDRSVADTATRLRTGVAEVSRALLTAYQRVAASVMDGQDHPRRDSAPGALAPLAAVPLATWRWDTAREDMTWSDGLFDLYGYPPGAIRPTIGVHQAHKQREDRTAVEHLVMMSATERGPIVFPQRIVRTDGTVCRVVMRVVREPGPGEVLTGRVVADVA